MEDDDEEEFNVQNHLRAIYTVATDFGYIIKQYKNYNEVSTYIKHDESGGGDNQLDTLILELNKSVLDSE